MASAAAVQPGEQITLGLHQRIIPNWHTYWLNPGDSGTATSIAWTLPADAKASEIQWPLPSRITQGPITNYGYSGEVTLLSTVTVPRDAHPGDRFPIQAHVKWLVCHDICIPQQAQLSLELPVAAAGAPQAVHNALIEQAKAQLPKSAPWPIDAQQTAHGLALSLPAQALRGATVKDVWFYPSEWGRIDHHAEQARRADDQGIHLTIQAGESPLKAGESLKGVLVVSTEQDGVQARTGYEVLAKLQGPSAQSPDKLEPDASLSLGPAIVLALLGGLILNLMPCVFPVLSIKALALLKHREHSPAQTTLHGVVYTGGVLVSFALLGLLMISLKAGGAQVGWGFQFQSPAFVLAAAYLMFAVGLSLSGVFTIGASVAGLGSSWADRSGYGGSFFTGVLAAVVATPCTAPFMGGAIGFAITRPPLELLAVFLSLGLGLALPFLLLSAWPPLQRLLPRPGLWMERLKQAMAFPMYAAAAWLVWVLAQQAGVNAVAIALGGLVVMAFAAWLYDSTRAASLLAQRLGTAFTVLALVGALAGGYAGIQASGQLASDAATASAGAGGKAPGASHSWEPYSPSRLQDLRASGRPVFVNLTAAWCITCLVNERVALSQPSVSQAFAQSGISYLKGDWTNQDPAISKLLTQFGRSGVPLYVLYPSGMQDRPVVLPQILTPDIVLAAVKDAATSPPTP